MHPNELDTYANVNHVNHDDIKCVSVCTSCCIMLCRVSPTHGPMGFGNPNHGTTHSGLCRPWRKGSTPLCSGSPRQTKPFIKRQSLMDFEARTVDFPRLQGSGPKFTHIPADKLKCHGKCIQFALKSMDSMAWGITVQRSCTRHRLNAGLAARFVCFHPWKGYKSHHRKRTLLLVGMESQHSPMTEITTRITLVAKASQHSNHQHETLSSPLSL